MKKTNMKIIAFIMALILVLAIIPFGAMNVFANNAYTLTFSVGANQNGYHDAQTDTDVAHSIVKDGNNLNIDNGQIITPEKASDGSAVDFTVASTGENTCTLTITNGEEVKLNFNSANKFDLYANGNPVNCDTVFSADNNIAVQNYVAPGNGNNNNNNNNNNSGLNIVFDGNAGGKVWYKFSTEANETEVTENRNNIQIPAGATSIVLRGEDKTIQFAALYKNGTQNNIDNDGLKSENGVLFAISDTDNLEFRIQYAENQNNQGNNQEFVNKIDVTRLDFRLNGKDCVVTSDNMEIPVEANMNFEGVDEFYITKVVTHDNENNTDRTYNYAAGEYSIGLKDAENRSILEVNFGKQTTNLAYLRIEAHTEDIKASDLAAMGKTEDDFYGFYTPQIRLIKPGLKGLVEVSTPHMPDVYDFVSFNGFELGDTSESNYADVTVYYGDDTINLTSLGSNITNIELVSGKGVLPSAVEIDVANKNVKIKSNYYNEIPLKITAKLEGGQTVVGYVKITRVGIYINDLNKGATVFYHGAGNGKVNENGGNLKVDTDKQRLVAVFYHSNTTTVNDYDLILNIINKDGTRETKLAKPVGDVPDEGNSPLVGSDYIIWEGNSIEDRPSRIYVTAVKKGATSNSNTFGGATFGAGAGITWTKD